MRRITTWIRKTVPLAGLLALLSTTAGAQTLSYNGDFDGVDGLRSEVSVTESMVYDNFVVTGSGWNVTGLFGTFLSSTATVTTALWEVRSGIAEGNGGSLLFSGTDNTSWVNTGFSSDFNLGIYDAAISGLSFFLAPGTYWFGYSPVGTGDDAMYLATTSGANGVDALLDQNAFFNSAFFGYDYASVSDNFGAYDFSLGVVGSAAVGTVPEPATMTLLAMGLAGMAVARRRGKRSR